MTARTLGAGLVLTLSVCLGGCRDDADNIVSSVEPDGGVIVDPGLGDRGVRDREVGGGPPDDGGGGDSSEAGRDAEGMRIRGDAGDAGNAGVDGGDAAPNASLDLGPEAGGGEFADHPLPPSRCGFFGPREALHANPARVMSYLHSGPGDWFDEPALYGCTPEALAWEAGVGDDRLWQRYTFEYDGIRARSGTWTFGEGPAETTVGRTLEVDRHGLVTAIAYDCGDGESVDVVRYRYDETGRLVHQARDGRGCPEMGSQLGGHFEYVYMGDARLPSRFVIRVEQIEIEIIRDLVYTREDGAITRIDTTDGGEPATFRLFTYDAAGRIEREERWRVGEDKADREISYAYDADGRLASRQDSLTGWYRFTYDAAGALAEVQLPNRGPLVQRGHPEHVTATVEDE